ncbi:ATP/GTP-binding protein [Cognatishimia sp. WU-CL00825]|uniref:YncE family protein n=1 Tax=Cognatishimia sp. WU-CL00825 TaxID=3127658 RepID=UPI00310501EC
MKLLTALFVCAATAAQAWETQGFDMPESIITDLAHNRIYVSNIVGSPMEADGNGYISLLNADGSLAQRQWATGMDAPKGMALFQGQLLVADLTKLHLVALDTGQVTQSFTLPNTVFLNDIAASDNAAWISDFMTGTIWKFDGQQASPWYASDDLPHPNGLWTDGTTLVVAGWGHNMQPDFSTSKPGDLVEIDIKTQSTTLLAKDLGNLDGLVASADGFIVNDWMNGAVYQLRGDRIDKILQAPMGTADLTISGQTLYLPHMLDGSVSTFDLN